MLKSKLCFLSQLSREELIAAGEDPDDTGGYFVVNGSERVIVAMEDLAPNRVIIDIDEKGTSPVYQAKIFSTTVGFRARIELKLKADDAIYVSMPGVPTEIPFVVIMRALSLEKDKDIAEAVSLDKDLQAELGPIIRESHRRRHTPRRHPIHRQPSCPRTSRRIPPAKSRNCPGQKLPPTPGQNRKTTQRQSHIPRRNGKQSHPTKNGQTPTRRQRPLQKQTSPTRRSTSRRLVPSCIQKPNTRHKIPT